MDNMKKGKKEKEEINKRKINYVKSSKILCLMGEGLNRKLNNKRYREIKRCLINIG